MTDWTPEELDAIVENLLETAIGCDHMVEFGLRDMCISTASAITSLRAREAMIEAAAIERAADDAYRGRGEDENCDYDCGWFNASVEAANSIRALITPGARTLLDQRIAEAEQAGYERGLKEAAPQFGKPITLQQAAKIVLTSQTVQAMASAWPPRDLVSTLLALSQGDAK